MEAGIIIKNLVIVAIILGTTFLSQQPLLNGVTKEFNFPLFKKGEGFTNNSYLSKTGDWLKDNVFSKLSGEVAKRGEIVAEEINTQKEAVTQSALDTTKKYLAEKVLQILNVKPEDLSPECKPQS